MDLKIKVDFDRGEENHLVRIIADAVERGVLNLEAIHKHIHTQGDALNYLIKKTEIFMADTKAQLDQISADLDDENAKLDAQAVVFTTVKGNLDGIKADIDDLNAQIGQLGSGANSAQIDELANKSAALKAKFDTASAALGDIAGEAKSIDDETTQTPPVTAPPTDTNPPADQTPPVDQPPTGDGSTAPGL